MLHLSTSSLLRRSARSFTVSPPLLIKSSTRFNGLRTQQSLRLFPLTLALRRTCTTIATAGHPTLPASVTTATKNVKLWLGSVAGMVFAMVSIGGVTRLTESGLSMTDWHLVKGMRPPMGEEAWKAEFERYKQFPEFERLNKTMTIDEFKNIFFWEYVHRMWGRAIGLAFGIPFVYFAARRTIRGPLLRRCSLLFAGIVGEVRGNPKILLLTYRENDIQILCS